MTINHNCNGHRIETNQSFPAIKADRKKALLIPFNDKYKVNDIVIIQEKSNNVITGRTCTRQISFIEHKDRRKSTILSLKPLYI